MDTLLKTIQKGGEFVRDYIERFHNFSLMYPAGMPLPILLQTCRHNFLDKVKVHMGAVKAHTWKKLIEQAEIAKILANKFETPKSRQGNQQQKLWHGWIFWYISIEKYMEELNQKKVTPTRLQSIRDYTPSKMSMWWHFFTCSTKVTSSSCQRLDAQTKWEEWTIQLLSFSLDASSSYLQVQCS